MLSERGSEVRMRKGEGGRERQVNKENTPSTTLTGVQMQWAGRKQVQVVNPPSGWWEDSRGSEVSVILQLELGRRIGVFQVDKLRWGAGKRVRRNCLHKELEVWMNRVRSENCPELGKCWSPGMWNTWARRAKEAARQDDKHQILKDTCKLHRSAFQNGWLWFRAPFLITLEYFFHQHPLLINCEMFACGLKEHLSEAPY